MSLAIEQLNALNGKLVYLTCNKAGVNVSSFVRIFHLPDADEAILDYSFRLDPREELVSPEDLVLAEEILDAGTDSKLTDHVSPQSAWDLFRAIIAAAMVTPGCFVDRGPFSGASATRCFCANCQTGFAIKSSDALDINRSSLASKQDMDSSLPEANPQRSDRLDAR